VNHSAPFCVYEGDEADIPAFILSAGAFSMMVLWSSLIGEPKRDGRFAGQTANVRPAHPLRL
jgi:hypothetical protein